MSIESHVERVAVRLDLFDPTWYTRISLGCLDLDDDYDCVLGQAFGGFNSAKSREFRKKWMRWTLTASRPFFYVRTARCLRAHRAWGDEILKRRARHYDLRPQLLRRRSWILAEAKTKVQA